MAKRRSGMTAVLVRRVAGASLVALLLTRTASGSCDASCALVNVADDTIHASCGVAGIGTCSLRDAMGLAVQVIQFSVGGGGHQTIALMSNLPAVAGMVIDGTTQPGYTGAPLIEITRGAGGTATHGLKKVYFPATGASGFFVLKGLVINGFADVCADCGGVVLNDSSDVVREGGNQITNCYIGTDYTGTTAVPNSYGIQDNTQGSNTYGGTTAADRNVISGNSIGISIGTQLSGYSTQNVIEGNYIGTDATGTILIPNNTGVMTGAPYPGFSPGILVGGSGPGAGNVIAGSVGIQMSEGINDVIEGNLIGLDATGMNKLGGSVGVILSGETNASILGNFIAGTTGGAIRLSEEPVTNIPTTGTIIRGNFLGTDITGTRAVASSGPGIDIGPGAPNNTVGGPVNGQGNFIGGFNQGIVVEGTGFVYQNTGSVIQGNSVGVGLGGAPIPNVNQAISLLSTAGGTTVGGINPGEGNVVAMNAYPGILVPGVLVYAGQSNVIRGNSIYGNSGLGIDYVFPFSTTPYPNDPGDGDTGPNGLQNFPILTSVTFPDGTHVRIQGVLNSQPVTHYTIDFYANAPPLHPTDFLQGQTWIGLYDNPAISDSSGNLVFDVTLPVPSAPSLPSALTAPNVWISATATDDSGNTSQFSQRSLFSISPRHGPSTGGTPFTLAGQLFQSGATVNFGSPPGGFATGVDVVSATEITGLTPGFPPGLYSVTVTNPDQSTAVMPRAYLMDFQDVPPGSALYPFVTSLALEGVTSGCGGVNYCPGDDITRGQMAVFLLKAIHGPFWVPPPATGTVFGDVPLGSFAAEWIEELFHEGVTGGCGGGDFCPGSPVTRAQMAPFLLKAEHGSAYVPPACAGIFGDVTCPSLFAPWIEELYAEAITGGCSASPLLYCPGNDVTRGQMAVFVVKTFHLP